jgi:ParB family chromosome partitioning protein
VIVISFAMERIQCSSLKKGDAKKPAYLTLVESVKRMGILNPLFCRRLDNHNGEVIDGIWRYHAAKAAGLTHVPVIIYRMTDEEVRK